jgi:hypothetical protein
MEQKEISLKATSGSDIAAITQLSTTARSFWCYYTLSQGGTKWDPRKFASADMAEKAAKEAGFQVQRNFNSCTPATNPHLK